jgi:hypothetical protein
MHIGDGGLVACRQAARGCRIHHPTSSSFDERRELAIHLKDPDVVYRLVKVVHVDWRNSHALDLSERAVLSGLERHPKNGGLARIAPLATNHAD